jgi:lysozyme
MANNLSAQGYVAKAVAKNKGAQEVAEMIGVNEGVKPKAYKDTTGNMSIGVGFNLEDKTNQPILDSLGLNREELKSGKRELTDKEISRLYSYSVSRAIQDLKKFDPDIQSRPKGVQMALIDMSYNLGYNKLSTFKKMKAALQEDNYGLAADEMVDSKWYKQVKTRGPRTVELMRSAAE